MDDYEMLKAFLCSEHQRLESYVQMCENLVKQYMDIYNFNLYLKSKYQYQLFLEIEKSLYRLFHLYD